MPPMAWWPRAGEREEEDGGTGSGGTVRGEGELEGEWGNCEGSGGI